jgi:8-oxo-dGTP diphosphatase
VARHKSKMASKLFILSQIDLHGPTWNGSGENNPSESDKMPDKPPRIAVRAIIVHDNRLLLVNAWAGQQSQLMCAPGGGVEIGTSLPENLKREVFEEVGLDIIVGPPVLVNEFHSPEHEFHQIEVFFRCQLVGPAEIDPNWVDTENVVNRHIWVRQEELANVMHKPSSLGKVAFEPDCLIKYDPLELTLL